METTTEEITTTTETVTTTTVEVITTEEPTTIDQVTTTLRSKFNIALVRTDHTQNRVSCKPDK